ncbi:MAG TPA: tripartite tricarboxylate transporter substrate binding protein [Burkholderiales bacterium]|jgi:tripartite-type tricarboxylate transporter receptor subunit TctC
MKILKHVVLMSVFACTAGAAWAQEDYPTHPVRMIIPFAPGGASDFVGRIVAVHFSELLGQQIIIENRTGAAGNIGMEAAAKSPPDGYTIYLGNIGTVAINPHIYSNLTINPLKDFAPVSAVADMPSALVANNSLPVKTVAELTAYIKARPGKLNFASPGSGSLNRLEMEMFRHEIGGDMVHVPYKGGAGPAAVGLVGGETQMMFSTLSSVISFVKAGRLKGLAVTSRERQPQLPDVPTMVESGYPEMVTSSWQGMFVPVGTPRLVVAKLYAALTKTLAEPDLKNKFANGGAVPISSKTPEAFGEFIAAESKRWGKVAHDAGAKAD